MAEKQKRVAFDSIDGKKKGKERIIVESFCFDRNRTEVREIETEKNIRSRKSGKQNGGKGEQRNKTK